MYSVVHCALYTVVLESISLSFNSTSFSEDRPLWMEKIRPLRGCQSSVLVVRRYRGVDVVLKYSLYDYWTMKKHWHTTASRFQGPAMGRDGPDEPILLILYPLTYNYLHTRCMSLPRSLSIRKVGIISSGMN